MGGDDSQNLLPWRGISLLSGTQQTSGYKQSALELKTSPSRHPVSPRFRLLRRFGCSSVHSAMLSRGLAVEMETSRIQSDRLIPAASSAFLLTLQFVLAGCAYRLPVPTLPSQQHLRVVTSSPEAYALRLRINSSRDFHVPPNGRVTLDVPSYRAACSVYLFDKLRIRRGANPFTARTIDVIVAGKVTQQLSLEEIAALPADPEGYHLLSVRARPK